VLAGTADAVAPYQGYEMVMTRLHARYGKDQAPDDLQFKKADAIVGGREFVIDQRQAAWRRGRTRTRGRRRSASS